MSTPLHDNDLAQIRLFRSFLKKCMPVLSKCSDGCAVLCRTMQIHTKQVFSTSGTSPTTSQSILKAATNLVKHEPVNLPYWGHKACSCLVTANYAVALLLHSQIWHIVPSRAVIDSCCATASHAAKGQVYVPYSFCSASCRYIAKSS